MHSILLPDLGRRRLLGCAAAFPLLAASGCRPSPTSRSADEAGIFDESRPAPNLPTELSADIVIVGAGGAGLAAAARAAEIGASVIVLEKMPSIGGNTLVASGYYAAVEPERQGAAGISDSVEDFYGLLYANAGPNSDSARLMRLALEAGPVMRWLEGLGVTFGRDVYEISGSLFPRNYRPVMPNGEGYVRQLSARALQLGVRLETNCRALALGSRMTAQGVARIENVLARRADGRLARFTGKLGILIASGGFSASSAMLERFAPRYAHLGHDNTPGATGEMLLAARDAGARLRDMDIVQCQPGCPPGGKRRVRFHNDVERFILLDADGRRFVAEDGRRDAIRDRVTALPGGLARILIDDDGFRSYNRSIQQEAVLAVESGDAVSADSLEDLARQSGLSGAALRETVERYNRGIREGRDEFGKNVRNARPIARPPFWMSTVAMTVHATSGGIDVDAVGRVLDTEGVVIPGLWAAGETVGGLHGENQLGGCGLTDAFVFGHAAAESILGVSTYTAV